MSRTMILIAVASLCCQVVAQVPGGNTHGGLEITVRVDGEISGILLAPREIQFSSRMEAQAKAALEIRLGEVVLHANADFLMGTRTLDGGGHALTLEERNGLEALSLALEEQLDPYRKSLPANEDFLFRVVSYWAAAPVGWPLEYQAVAAPTQYQLEPDSEAGGCQSGSKHDPSESGCTRKNCQRNDNDGVTLLFGCACIGYSGVYHDTKVIRWYGLACGHRCKETLVAGCDRDKSCLGRCSAGCGLGGRGVYTVDCLDHDRCCRVHGGCVNPIGLACGDEYQEAADDFLFGFWNCSGCSSGDACGDENCDAGLDEDTCSCPGDCGVSCGDGCCNGSETSANCALDCATVACCLPTSCCREDLLAGDCLGLDGTAHAGMTCDDIQGVCPAPPEGCPTKLTTCGDGVCDEGEDSCNCADCVNCGDGCCGSEEDADACPEDCILACALPVGCCGPDMTLTDCENAGGTASLGLTCEDIAMIPCDDVAIPTVGTWGIGVIALLVAAMGTVIFHARRQAMD